MRGWAALVALVFVFGQQSLSALLAGTEVLDPALFEWGSFFFVGIGVVLLLVVGGMVASWYFTRFIIDETELRVETGAVFRQSKRIPFTKVQSVDITQPFAARLFGMAELSIDAGADGSTTLRYLRRGDADRFRNFLLIRAHGRRASEGEPPASGTVASDVQLGRAAASSLAWPSRLSDVGERSDEHSWPMDKGDVERSDDPTRLSAAREQDLIALPIEGVGERTEYTGRDVVLVTVQPGSLILAALLSLEICIPLILFVVMIGPVIWFGVWYVIPAYAIPFVAGAGRYVNKYLFSQFNYTLAQLAGSRLNRVSGQGLKISRGLTSLTSQAVPTHRIQALKISQSLLWRPFGLYRVEMDTLGAVQGIDQDGGPGNSILLPAGTAAQVETVITAIWPEADLADVVGRPSPQRARWFRPIAASKLRYGSGHAVAVTESGRLLTVKKIVPHRRVQSVRIVQGPLQRRLNLADVQLHTVGGVISTVAKHLDSEDARTFAEQEVENVRR